jgi:hypothetical protein
MAKKLPKQPASGTIAATADGRQNTAKNLSAVCHHPENVILDDWYFYLERGLERVG